MRTLIIATMTGAAGQLNSAKVPTLKHLIQITDQHVKGTGSPVLTPPPV
jgi:hypothetical protein